MEEINLVWSAIAFLIALIAGSYKLAKEIKSFSKFSRKFFVVSAGGEDIFVFLATEFLAENGELYLFVFDITPGSSAQVFIEKIFSEIWSKMGFFRRLRWRYYKIIKNKFSFFQIRSFVVKDKSQLIFKFNIDFPFFSIKDLSSKDFTYTPICCSKSDLMCVQREAGSFFHELREEWSNKSSFPYPLCQDFRITNSIKAGLFQESKLSLQDQLLRQIARMINISYGSK